MAGGWSKMSDEPLVRERELIERVRARLEALVRANAAPRCGARSKRTGKPCQAAAMPNGRCKVHGGKSTGPRTPDRFARDLTVQLTGHDFLKSLGISLIPATAPDFFTEETPTAVLVRQVLGAIAQFEKTSLVAKLRAARDRKKAATGKCGGRKSYAEARPEVVALAKELHSRRMSLRKISEELAVRGHFTSGGKPYVASGARWMGDSCSTGSQRRRVWLVR